MHTAQETVIMEAWKHAHASQTPGGSNREAEMTVHISSTSEQSSFVGVSEAALPNLYHRTSTNPGYATRRSRGHEHPSRKTYCIRPMRNGTP
jgi:hypothetical protein